MLTVQVNEESRILQADNFHTLFLPWKSLTNTENMLGNEKKKKKTLLNKKKMASSKKPIWDKVHAHTHSTYRFKLRCPSMK